MWPQSGLFHLRTRPHFVGVYALVFAVSFAPETTSAQLTIRREGNSLILSTGTVGLLKDGGDGCITSGCIGEQVNGAYVIIRPHLLGEPDDNQHELHPPGTANAGNHIIPVSVGQTWLIGWKICYRRTLGRVGCERGWREARYTIIDAATDLKAEDASEWLGYRYDGRIRLTWQPAQGAGYVKVKVHRHRVGQSELKWDETLGGGASSFDTPGLPLEEFAFEVLGFTQDGQPAGDPLRTSFKIPLPAPLAPGKPVASMLDADQVRLRWQGDNVTQFFEIERLHLPPGTDRVERQSVDALAGGAKIDGRAAGGISALPKTRTAPSAITGGNASPALTTAPSSDASKAIWVTAMKVEKEGLDAREHIAIDRVTPISAAIGGAIYQPYTYRVCAMNTSGRTCSDAVELPSNSRREVPLIRNR